MLWLEHEVVASMVAHRDQQRRQAVEAYVDGALRAMPQHLRLGVAAESVVLGVMPAFQRAFGRLDATSMEAHLRRWSLSPLGPVRQYMRLLHSLVLFADHELEPRAGG
jgi:hypothetical protein